MEHFRIIQSICRIGLPLGDTFKFQVERLEKALRSSNEDVQADALLALLNNQSGSQSLKPSRIVRSSAILQGENLGSKTPLPVDKETSAPLCEVRLPSQSVRPILPKQIEDAVDRLVEEWNHEDQLIAMNAAPPRTCLLFGKPGTGKTRLAYSIGDALGLPVVLARLDGLISSYLGTTARNIGMLFDFANRYRCVLLLDEFDAVAKLRDDPQEVGEIKRVVNTLLQNIDKRKDIGYTLAITNHEGLLDSAIWRRFEIRLHIPLPSRSEREQILQRYLEPLPVNKTTLTLLGWFSDGLSGSDLEGMARSLKRYATVHSDAGYSLLEGIRGYAVTNASSDLEQRLSLVLRPPQELAKILMTASDVGLSQQDVGTLLNKDQATISRWLKNDPN
jgi:hypothetical protein